MKIKNKNPSAIEAKGHLNTIIPMTIGDSKLIADLLRKHYQFPLRTAIQEYLSNARDAHRLVHQTKKIQIKLPTKKYSFFAIRDFGPGMSDEHFVEYFCKYASSSKRDSDSFTGGFGLGSKIAWAYRDNFFVTNFYNGVKKVYEASTALHYEGGLQLLEESPTKEANGLELLLPIEAKDYEHFFDCFNLVSYLWNDLEIINYSKDELKIENPSFFLETENIAISNPSLLINKFHKKEWLISLDNIIYPLPHSCTPLLQEFKNNKFQIFLKFKSGELTPTISREYLEETSENLGLIKEKIKTGIKDIINFRKQLKEDIKQSTSNKNIKELITLYNNIFPSPHCHEFELANCRVKLTEGNLAFAFKEEEKTFNLLKVGELKSLKKNKATFISETSTIYYLPKPIIKKENAKINSPKVEVGSLLINQVISDDLLSYMNNFLNLKPLGSECIDVEDTVEDLIIPCLSFDLQTLTWNERKYSTSRLKKHEIADASIQQVPVKFLAKYTRNLGGKMF